MPVEERKAAGAAANRLKKELEESYTGKQAELENALAEKDAAGKVVDITLPGVPAVWWRPPHNSGSV